MDLHESMENEIHCHSKVGLPYYQGLGGLNNRNLCLTVPEAERPRSGAGQSIPGDSAPLARRRCPHTQPSRCASVLKLRELYVSAYKATNAIIKAPLSRPN